MSDVYIPTHGTAHGGGGEDGFSPIITEKVSTDDTYILEITDKYATFDTPNLKGPAGADGTVEFDDLTPAQKASLKGDKGDRGDQGPQGVKGDTGATGADGDDGFSPTVVVKTSTSDTYVLTVTDVNGSYDTPNLKGSGGGGGSGTDGTTFYPTVSSQGVISWTNDGGKQNPEPVNIKGPQGDTGATGPQGERGIQGERGPQGETGAAGYTPVRGTDYWTQADQTAIVNQVLAALPAAESVSA